MSTTGSGWSSARPRGAAATTPARSSSRSAPGRRPAAARVAANTDRAVIERTRRSLAATDELTRIESLLGLSGVGVPTASTLLHFAFPQAYPILDVRALDSLAVKPRSPYPVSFWLEYLGVCRELAARSAVSIRTLDKALWQHSKERSSGVAGQATLRQAESQA